MGVKRNECYPSLPAVDWAPTPGERAARREAVDWRNAMIGEVGAERASTAAKKTGGNIGAGKKEAKG